MIVKLACNCHLRIANRTFYPKFPCVSKTLQHARIRRVIPVAWITYPKVGKVPYETLEYQLNSDSMQEIKGTEPSELSYYLVIVSLTLILITSTLAALFWKLLYEYFNHRLSFYQEKTEPLYCDVI